VAVHRGALRLDKQNGITSIYVYRPEGTFNTTTCGHRWCVEFARAVHYITPVSTKATVGKNGVNQIRSRGIHRAPLARQGEGALSPLFVVIGSPNRTRTHQKIYFLRRWPAAREETGDEDDGGVDGREEEEANAANLLFLRNSQ
jgi:hypothetical protein